MTAVADLLLRTERRFLKFDGDVLAQICAKLRPCAPASAASAGQIAEAEKFAEDVAEILEYGWIKARASSCPATHSGMTEAVVHASLFSIGKHGVGFAALFELLFRIGVIRIPVRMVLQRQFAIRAFDLLFARSALDTQHLVIISFHVCWQSFRSPSLKISVSNFSRRAPSPDAAGGLSACSRAAALQ